MAAHAYLKNEFTEDEKSHELAQICFCVVMWSFSCFQGLDVGEESIKEFTAAIGRAKTIVWNG